MWREVCEASRQAAQAFNIILLLLKRSQVERRRGGGRGRRSNQGQLKSENNLKRENKQLNYIIKYNCLKIKGGRRKHESKSDQLSKPSKQKS